MTLRDCFDLYHCPTFLPEHEEIFTGAEARTQAEDAIQLLKAKCTAGYRCCEHLGSTNTSYISTVSILLLSSFMLMRFELMVPCTITKELES